jgi:uncharacterized protein (TIGR00303 family)
LPFVLVFASYYAILDDGCPVLAETSMTSNFRNLLNDPLCAYADIEKRVYEATTPVFLLCCASSGVSDIEGISAAGVSAADRRLTPAIDAEALLLGRPLSAKALPVSPKGIVSPVVLTRACLQLSGINATVIDCGSFVRPAVDHMTVGDVPARCPSTGQALTIEVVERLFDIGLAEGARLSRHHDCLLIGECVPGGTTTALGVLAATGLPVTGLVSSSLPVANHSAKQHLIGLGLKSAGHSPEYYLANPLAAVAAAGDPMQAFVTGMALAAAKRVPVVLAGGSQMLAVQWLMQCMIRAGFKDNVMGRLLVATTKWVAFDASAQAVALAKLTDAMFVASCPDFLKSRHEGLRAYEEGNVKEGVGAGAAMWIAHLRGHEAPDIMTAIDNSYDLMVMGNCAKLS